MIFGGTTDPHATLMGLSRVCDPPCRSKLNTVDAALRFMEHNYSDRLTAAAYSKADDTRIFSDGKSKRQRRPGPTSALTAARVAVPGRWPRWNIDAVS